MRQEVVNFAKKFVGTPYKYGAKLSEAPKFFDCSGFVQYVYGHFGYEIPRSTILQAAYAGKKIFGLSKILPGDLIFYRSIRGHYNPKYPQGIGHEVMYLGNGKGIHANSKIYSDYPKMIQKGSVKIQSLKKILKSEKRLVVIKRII